MLYVFLFNFGVVISMLIYLVKLNNNNLKRGKFNKEIFLHKHFKEVNFN